VGALHDILKVRIESHEIVLTSINPQTAAGLKPLCDEMIAMGERLQLRAATPNRWNRSFPSPWPTAEACIRQSIRPSLEDHFFKQVTGE